MNRMKPFAIITVIYVVFSFRLRKGVTVAVVPFLFLPLFRAPCHLLAMFQSDRVDLY